MGLSLPHLAILALVVLILFGRGRISEMMGDFGKGINLYPPGQNALRKRIGGDGDDRRTVRNSPANHRMIGPCGTARCDKKEAGCGRKNCTDHREPRSRRTNRGAVLAEPALVNRQRPPPTLIEVVERQARGTCKQTIFQAEFVGALPPSELFLPTLRRRSVISTNQSRPSPAHPGVGRKKSAPAYADALP